MRNIWGGGSHSSPFSPFPSSLLSLILDSPFSLPFSSLPLPSPFHSPIPNPFPKSSKGIWRSAVSSPSGVRAEPRPQTHFGAFTALKTHLVAHFFSRLCATQMTILIIRICCRMDSRAASIVYGVQSPDPNV